ncbi:MAG: Uncharacterized protein G01um101470_746 [Parcubacteria group bacterium Gr01-1014_70]|nr:MAG: Uncharacterized protein G01um101470_746 [Parcubacteria group bacterium Gr01-1014_70]
MRGFTLIEILVVIAIAAILFTIVVSGFSGLRQNSDLSHAIDDSVSYLQSARAKSLSAENATVYGVHFETGRFVLFTGTTYDAGNAANIVRLLPSTVETSAISLNGGAVDVVFKRLTGETDAYGTITFRLISSPSTTKTIEIVSTGLSGVQ